jgi:prevent-host-death family protein
MDEIAISEFKAKCLAIVERVRRTKTPIRITRFGRPVAEVVPIPRATETIEWLGSLSECMTIRDDIASSVIQESDLEALH